MTDIKRSELWQRLRAARRRAGLTQQDVADHFEIDRTAISKWEARGAATRARPDIAKLEEFAHLTRTPVWWLLSDEVDVLEPWPEVIQEGEPPKAPRTHFIRDFWDRATLEARRLRPDIWHDEIWYPDGPEWLLPVMPDVKTKRCIVQIVQAPRMLKTRIAAAAASLIAFEKFQGRDYERKVVLVWTPRGPDLSEQEQSYLIEVRRAAEGARLLLERLGVRYIEVQSVDEAAHYLVQLL